MTHELVLALLHVAQGEVQAGHLELIRTYPGAQSVHNELLHALQGCPAPHA